MFSLAFIRDNFTFILSALPVTLVITLLSLLFSTLLGAALAWVIIRQVPGVQWGAKVFLSFSRSVPVLVMLYFFFYVWPWIAAGLFGGPQDNMYHYKLSPLVAAVTALSLIFSAYFAETFRAGWNAVDKGQREGRMVNWAKRVHAVPTHYFSAGGSIRTAELHQRADRSD